jgi:hypothetical protein
MCPLELHFDADESLARVNGNERVKRKLLINNSWMGSINNRAPYVMSVAAMAVGMQLATNTCSLWDRRWTWAEM